MRLLLVILTWAILSMLGCAKCPLNETDIPGYIESSDCEEVLLTYSYETGNDNGFNIIIKQPLRMSLNAYRNPGVSVIELDDTRFGISEKGDKILYEEWGSIDNADITILEKRGSKWVKTEVASIPCLNTYYNFAISPDGNWGLFTSYSDIYFRNKGDGLYNKPTTKVYLLNLINLSHKELNGVGEGEGLYVITITRDEVLACRVEDVVGYWGRLETRADFLCAFDINDPFAGWEYVHTCEYLYPGLRALTYTDSGELKILRTLGGYTSYRSYTEGSNVVEEIFKTDIAFVDACTDRNGNFVAGLARSVSSGSYTLYIIDTLEKEYVKYPLGINNDVVRKLDLVRLHITAQ